MTIAPPRRQPVDHATYWRAPISKQLTPSYWIDPEPDVFGMLASDRIRTYDKLVGGMIRPFQEDRLKPASYELTLGPKCLLEGRDIILTDAEPHLEIPPNSIVFVSVLEVLLLPHWLSARFDLAVTYLYKGLLVGTGPQVDPGFQGVLSCPVHNISSNPVTLRYRDPLLKIDFTKTTGLGDAQGLADVETEDDLYRQAPTTANGEKLVLWKRQGQYREPIVFEPESRHAKSSLRKMERFVNLVRGWSIALILGYLTALVAVFACLIGAGAYISHNMNSRIDAIERRGDRVVELEDQLRRQRAAQRELRSTVGRLERAAADLP